MSARFTAKSNGPMNHRHTGGFFIRWPPPFRTAIGRGAKVVAATLAPSFAGLAQVSKDQRSDCCHYGDHRQEPKWCANAVGDCAREDVRPIRATEPKT